MANKIEMANDVVVESGFKQMETTTLWSGVTADSGAPTVITDGVALGDSYGGVVVVKPETGDSTDARIWLYFNSVGAWVRCIEVDKTAIDEDGNAWKVLVGGADRLYVELINTSAATGIDVYFLRSYS